MAIIESTNDRLVLQAGSLLSKTTLTLDKATGRAALERSAVMWRGKPREFALSDIADVDILSIKDPLSGADTHTPALRLRAGDVIAMPAGEREATETAEKVRAFLGLAK
jgi:hypothetical protein